MPLIKSPVELEMMRGLKRLLRSQQHPQSRPGAAGMTAFREIEDRDVEAVVALWQACGLTRPWNDPYKDISFAREGREVHHPGGRARRPHHRLRHGRA